MLCYTNVFHQVIHFWDEPCEFSLSLLITHEGACLFLVTMSAFTVKSASLSRDSIIGVVGASPSLIYSNYFDASSEDSVCCHI